MRRRPTFIIIASLLLLIAGIALSLNAHLRSTVWIDKSGVVVADQNDAAPAKLLGFTTTWDFTKEGMVVSVKQFADGSNVTLDMPFAIHDPLYRVRSSSNRFGFVNSTGNLAIPAVYIDARGFRGGLCSVETPSGQWCIIDKAGSVVCSLPPGWKPNGNNQLQEGLIGLTQTNSPFGHKLYDVRKKAFITLPDGSIQGGDFSEGLCMINDFRGDCAYITPAGTVAIAERFDYAGEFHDGLAVVKKNGKWKYIDKEGKTRITLPENCSAARDFSEGLAAIALGGENDRRFAQPEGHLKVGAKWGFIDTSGTVVIPPKFFVGTIYTPYPYTSDQCVSSPATTPRFSEGLAGVGTEDTGCGTCFGFIDKTGQWKIEPRFRQTQDFKNGLAKVRL